MSKAVINFKVDKEVKEEAQKLAKELGMPLSSIINSQLKQLLRTRSFELNATPTMTPFLEDIIAQIEEDRKLGRNFSPEFSSIEEMLEQLDNIKWSLNITVSFKNSY